MAKTTPADTATSTVESDAIAAGAAQSALDAAARSPEYPGYEAVRDLYESYLRLSRRYDDLAALVESLKNDLADTRRGASNNG
jgi:hypothetical protein